MFSPQWWGIMVIASPEETKLVEVLPIFGRFAQFWTRWTRERSREDSGDDDHDDARDPKSHYITPPVDFCLA